MSQTVESFEETLEQGRDTVASAREEYETLQETQTVPEQLIEAVGQLERELEELDGILTVEPEDVDRATQVTRRSTILAETISALRQRQRTVVEADVRRLQNYVAAVQTLADTTGEQPDTPISTPEKTCSLCEKLIDRDRHHKVRTSTRFDLSELDWTLRRSEAELATSASAVILTDVYLDFAETLLDDIHESLGALHDKNENRTAYSTDLNTIKETLNDVETTDESDRDDELVREARIAIEGCLILQYQTTRAHAEQRVAKALAEAIRETELTVNCDVQSCVDRGEVNTLLEAITDAIVSDVERSTSVRIRQLLEDHDGNVVQTAQVTDFALPEILDVVETLHSDDEIEEITVHFDS